jgi:hypothetical protein
VLGYAGDGVVVFDSSYSRLCCPAGMKIPYPRFTSGKVVLVRREALSGPRKNVEIFIKTIARISAVSPMQYKQLTANE